MPFFDTFPAETPTKKILPRIQRVLYRCPSEVSYTMLNPSHFPVFTAGFMRSRVDRSVVPFPTSAGAF